MSRVRLRPGAASWREIDGEIVAVQVDDGTYLATNRTGATLWPSLAEGASVEELSSRLVDSFGIDEATARDDVAAFLRDLAARKLVEDVLDA